jgi:hypothetical protein
MAQHVKKAGVPAAQAPETEASVWLEPVVNDVHNASACVGKIDGMVNIRHLSAAKAKGLKVGAELFLDFVPA